MKSTFFFFFFFLGKIQISVKLLIQQDNFLVTEAVLFLRRLCGDCTSGPRALTVFVVAQCKPREDRVRGCLRLCSLSRPTVSHHGTTQEVSVPPLSPRAKKHAHSLGLSLWASKTNVLSNFEMQVGISSCLFL